MRPTGVKPTVPFFAPARLSNDHLMKLNGKTDPLFFGKHCGYIKRATLFFGECSEGNLRIILVTTN